jgi:hypothetical protein
MNNGIPRQCCVVWESRTPLSRRSRASKGRSSSSSIKSGEQEHYSGGLRGGHWKQGSSRHRETAAGSWESTGSRAGGGVGSRALSRSCDAIKHGLSGSTSAHMQGSPLRPRMGSIISIPKLLQCSGYSWCDALVRCTRTDSIINPEWKLPQRSGVDQAHGAWLLCTRCVEAG